MKTVKALVLCGSLWLLICTLAACTAHSEDDDVAETQATAVDDSETSAAGTGGLGSVTLGEYKGIKVAAQSTEVTEKLIDDDIEYLRQNDYTYEPITDRASQLGDTVNIDYTGKENGEAFSGGTGQQYDLELGSGRFVANFEDECVGLKAGDEKTFDLTFPENYGAANLAGHTVQFTVKVNEVKQKVIPELNDAWVQKYTDGAQKTVAEYREFVRNELQTHLDQTSYQAAQYNALQTVINNSQLDIKPEAIEEEYDSLMADTEKQLSQYGMDLEQYASINGMTVDEYKAQIKANAQKIVAQDLVIKAIYDAEKMTLDDSDYEYVAEYYGMSVDEIKSTVSQDVFDQAAMNFKVTRFLYDNAEIVKE